MQKTKHLQKSVTVSLASILRNFFGIAEVSPYSEFKNLLTNGEKTYKTISVV